MQHQEIAMLENVLRQVDLPEDARGVAREALDGILLKLPVPEAEKTLKQRALPIVVKVMGIAADVQFLILVNVLGKH